ncbi:MAG: ribbon-helix-helix protein, CopG family [Vicinamibacteria bacterium]
MPTIQIVLEESLLKAADREVKRLKTNRSRLFRVALQEHLKRSAIRADEERERQGYERIPEGTEMVAFEKVAAWPED